MAFYSLAGGIIGALLAVVPGLIDFLSISEPKTKRIGAIHLTLNLMIVGLYALNLWLRSQSPAGAMVPVALSVVGMILLLIFGWLGGEMVYRRAVGVDIEGETAPTDVKTKRIA